jgi:hypothetical protein
MNIRHTVLATAIVSAAVLAMAAGVYAQHGRHAAPVSIDDSPFLVPSAIDRDPSVPDAATALRGQHDSRAEQPPTF